jgi:hypothetical protein
MAGDREELLHLREAAFLEVSIVVSVREAELECYNEPARGDLHV